MTRAPFIDGIHNYCDRCCHRCRFTDRCACAVVLPAGGDEPADPMRAITASVINALSHAMTTVQQVAEHVGVDLRVSPEEMREAERWHDEKVSRATTDPLVVDARDYALQATPIARALRHLLATDADPALLEAATRLEETAGTIASKIYRAVSNALEPDFDAGDLQSDANGSAKVARLLIEESRRAWRALMAPGRAAADGVPARLVGALDTLEAGLCRRFPRALEFVRPGFDTAEADPAAGQLAAALRQPVTSGRHG